MSFFPNRGIIHVPCTVQQRAIKSKEGQYLFLIFTTVRWYFFAPFFPESVWAQGSSNSGGLYLIFSSSHLLIFTPSLTSSHLHICSSSHLLIFTPSLTSANLHTFSHIFSSSHLLIFTSSHLHIFSSSHLLIFTSAHLHIFLSSHLLIFTSAHLHISIFTYSHLLFLSLSLSPLSSLLSLFPFSLPFLSLAFFIFLSLGRGWCQRGVTKREPFRTKWGSIGENWGKIAILLVPEQPFRTKWGSIGKNWGKSAILLVPEQPFHTKWGSIGENWGKIAILLVPEQPFRTKRGSIVKNWSKIASLKMRWIWIWPITIHTITIVLYFE